MYILGLNSVYHESSACLIKNGEIVAAAEEERFNRMKHGKQARADNPDELPMHSIRFCLDAAGIEISDLAHIACAADPEEIKNVREFGFPSAWSNEEKQNLFIDTLPNIPKKLVEMGFQGAFHWVAHHTAHAASAYFVAPYAESAVLVVDALGDDAFSTRFYYGEGNKLKCLKNIRYPSSIGYLWELVSILLGFDVYDAAKVMGLAAYGDPQRYAGEFDAIAYPTADGGFEMAHDLLRFSDISYYPPSAYCEGLENLFGIKKREKSQPLEAAHFDIAAALQQKTDELMFHMTEHLHRLTGSFNLCLAGGVALNCVSTHFIFENGSFNNLYVQSAAHDGGLSLGAAFYVWNHILDNDERGAMPHAYLGPSFSDDEIEEQLRKYQLKYEKFENIEEEIARLISRQMVVGFFQGGMEFGPRALGNRSILADPRAPDMREILNHKVKHREYFRPFAPSVLHEEATNWFHITKEALASDFMLVAYPARENVKDKIPSVLHKDGTGRVQTVKSEANPRFHRVISEFYKLTGIPLLLNTSFNDQEPIICTPADAIHTFMKTEIDFLGIGSFLVRKESS